MQEKVIEEYLKYDRGRLKWIKSPRNGISLGDPADTSISAKGTSHPYRITGFNKKRYQTHRIIYYLHYKTWPQIVDHINGNTLDNRIENLRACSYAENARNSRKSKRNTSGVKGVTWNKSRKKWQAGVTVNKKFKNLGYYESIEDAEQARKNAVSIIHGEFARHS